MEKVIKVPSAEIKQVKETLANIAIEQLEIGNDIDLFENTVVEFGYIYLRADNHEALFKVLTDRKTIYFAVQKGKLMRLQNTFNDELFEGTIQQMEAIHGAWK